MDVNERIKKQLDTYPVLLYMKGTPDFPQCGFSAKTVGILRATGAKFAYINIFEDPEIELADVPAALRQRRARRRVRHCGRALRVRRAQADPR